MLVSIAAAVASDSYDLIQFSPILKLLLCSLYCGSSSQ